MNESDVNYISVNDKIIDVKVKLDYILNKFTNDDFEYFEPYPVVYNKEIKFVPIELKEKVLGLFVLLEQLEQIKHRKKIR